VSLAPVPTVVVVSLPPVPAVVVVINVDEIIHFVSKERFKTVMNRAAESPANGCQHMGANDRDEMWLASSVHTVTPGCAASSTLPTVTTINVYVQIFFFKIVMCMFYIKEEGEFDDVNATRQL
jgi:hypothetical protein